MSLSLSRAVSASCLTADKPVTGERKPDDFEVQQGDLIDSETSCYLVLDFLGKGCYGKVTKCVNIHTAKEIALKIIKSETSRVSKREIAMLEVVSVLDPIKTNVVQFFEKFKLKGRTCLTFEILDMNLLQLLLDRQWMPLSLSEIRPIANQLLTAFDALKGIGVVHSDLKLNNVMLVNHEDMPFRVKLIDFGVSFKTSDKMHGSTIQPLGYRAPEVHLGLPISEAIDMWGLGCVLSFLYLSNPLFRGGCEYQLMRSIVAVLGQPADYLLFNGRYTEKFFKEAKHWDYPRWRLKTPREYQLATGIDPMILRRSVRSLNELITFYPEIQEYIEMEDRRAFVSLLKCLLHLDSEQRITPGEALKHPFLSMGHLKAEMDTSSYVDNAFKEMMVCQMDYSEEERKNDAEVAVLSCSSAAGSVTPCSCDSISNGADRAAAEDTTGSAEEEPAVSREAASNGPAEETSATNGSPDEGAPVKVKTSGLGRIREFFSRTIFGQKK